MIKEVSFDPIFDSQQAFRVLLDAFSHPGKIYSFEQYALNQPTELYPSNAIVALSLFDNNISFHTASSYNENVATYIHLNTSSNIEVIEKADYVFLNGSSDIAHLINECKIGELSYPEKNATIIISVAQISASPIDDYNFQLILSGPGIKSENILFVHGLSIETIQNIVSLNTEFPLGVDILLTDAFENICSIPRSIVLQIIQKN